MTMILTASVNNLMRTLFQMAQDKVGELLGVPGECEKLTDMVYQIEGVLIDAERRQNEDESINRWVLQLKNVMYDADDVIDLCRMKIDERRAKSGSSSSSKTSCGFHFLSCFRNPVFAHEIAGKIKELNSTMNAIVSRIGLLKLVENRSVSSEAQQMASNISRETYQLVVQSDIVGEKIEQDVEQLVELLTKDAIDEQRSIPIVAIVGMGGIGKTTLAKMVSNDPRIKAEFKLLIWICVSKELRPVDMLQNVIREFGGDYGKAKKESELVPRLEQCVRGKKFLLVLDDIWEESEKIWVDSLRDPMMSRARGSRVLITTRDGGVALRMGAVYSHMVRELSDEDGWSLLVKQVVRNGVESDLQDLKDIGMQMVQRCDGLPIAIKSIGGMLCMKARTKGMWQDVLSSKVWSIEKLPSDIYPTFHLSYADLKSHLKQCFIVCSLFREDFLFTRPQLISLWLAEGILQKDDFWQKGCEYYKELLLRNFLEDTGDLYDEAKCKMHDLLLSFARHLGKNENTILSNGQDLLNTEGPLKMRRLSVEGYEVNNNVEAIKNEKGLRTLILHHKYRIELDDICKAVLRLRILDLTLVNISSLPDSLYNLVHLRHLNVKYTGIRTVPNSIEKLKNLEYFDCMRCKQLSQVSGSIMKLRELRLLNFRETYQFTKFPAGLENLENLVKLIGFKPSENSSQGLSSLDGLEALSQLNSLWLEGLERVTDKTIAKRANLRSKNQLQSLNLNYASLSPEKQLSQTNEKKMAIEDVLNEFSPSCSLEGLKIEGYFGNHLPNWLNSWKALPNLRFVEISDCACFERLGPLGQLDTLDFLRIKGAYSITTVDEEFLWGSLTSRDAASTSHNIMPPFPKLNTLVFNGMLNWEEWQWDKKFPAMPKLKRLFIKACPKLKSLPDGLSHHTTSLEYLQITDSDNLSAVENFLSIKEIRVFRNPNLERISNLPRVSFITISKCPKLTIMENLDALQTMELTDLQMEILPEYLIRIKPKKLVIECKLELLLKIVNPGEGDSELYKFEHVPTVKFSACGEILYATYQKEPLKLITNVTPQIAQINLRRYNQMISLLFPMITPFSGEGSVTVVDAADDLDATMSGGGNPEKQPMVTNEGPVLRSVEDEMDSDDEGGFSFGYAGPITPHPPVMGPGECSKSQIPETDLLGVEAPVVPEGVQTEVVKVADAEDDSESL